MPPLLIDTPVLELLGISLPIIQAPMATATTPELVAAASAAGALGSLPAARQSADDLASAIARVRALTDRPFAVNFLLAPPDASVGDVEAVQQALDRLRSAHDLPPGSRSITLPPSELDRQVGLTLDAGVRIVSVAMGPPGPLVRRAHAAGAVVLATATTVEEARRLETEGVDAIVAQGAEAGGHRSTFAIGAGGRVPLIGTMALVPAVVDSVRCPVIASGGIMDARGLVAALALGASAVQMGTRFLLAEESGAAPAYRAALCTATETDTEMTTALTGRPARALRNAVLEAIDGARVPSLGWPYQGAAAADLYAAAAQRGDASLAPLLAGQGVRLANRVQPTREIIDELVRDSRQLLRTLTT